MGGRDSTQDGRWCPGRSVVKTVQGVHGEGGRVLVYVGRLKISPIR